MIHSLVSSSSESPSPPPAAVVVPYISIRGHPVSVIYPQTPSSDHDTTLTLTKYGQVVLALQSPLHFDRFSLLPNGHATAEDAVLALMEGFDPETSTVKVVHQGPRNVSLVVSHQVYTGETEEVFVDTPEGEECPCNQMGLMQTRYIVEEVERVFQLVTSVFAGGIDGPYRPPPFVQNIGVAYKPIWSAKSLMHVDNPNDYFSTYEVFENGGEVYFFVGRSLWIVTGHKSLQAWVLHHTHKPEVSLTLQLERVDNESELVQDVDQGSYLGVHVKRWKPKASAEDYTIQDQWVPVLYVCGCLPDDHVNTDITVEVIKTNQVRIFEKKLLVHRWSVPVTGFDLLDLVCMSSRASISITWFAHQLATQSTEEIMGPTVAKLSRLFDHTA
jgi:hypothetical protein